MDLPKEKKIDEFMKNTGTDRSEALNILNRNKWNLTDSYKEIEEMCRSKLSKSNDVDRHQTVNMPQVRAIDMGRGAAVNLDRKASPAGMMFDMHPKQPSSSQPYPPSYDSLAQNMAVKLPPNKTERIIPIHIQGGGSVQPKVLGGQTVLYNGPTTGSSPASPSQSALSTYSRHRVGLVDIPIHHEPRVVINEAVNPSSPKTIAPSGIMRQQAEEHDDDELEDVFDETALKKPPPTNRNGGRLKRGFSNILENECLVSEARYNVQADIKKDNHDNMYVQTFVLPDFTVYPDDFRAFLEKDLVETSTLVSLEQAGRLNWWAELRLCQRLLPMATSGDGNCLLHAASLAMWGIHDRQLILRTELHDTLTTAPYKAALYRRWRYQQTLTNRECGLVFSEAEWSDEWENILRLASTRPRGAPDRLTRSRSNNCCDSAVTQGSEESVVYESLEEFHVFVLAHVLQRPIIIVADAILRDTSGEALAPIPFPGVYLPLEMPKCYRSPLLLTYDAAHFSALSPMEQDPNSHMKLPAAIPLVDPDLRLLPLHFYIDPGPTVDWKKPFVMEPSLEDKVNLLQRFLEVERIPLRIPDFNSDSDHASCGSQDSDECGSILGGKVKKKKDARMAQQMQSVANAFGSIGKTMGKKLKQLGKSSKVDKGRRPSIGNEITQSTRVITSLGVGQGNGKEFILVANLLEKRSPNHQKMIKNYLEVAEERFRVDKEFRKKNNIELRSRVSNPGSICATPGCNAYGTFQNNYLCSTCYTTQLKEQNKSQNNLGEQKNSNTFPGRGRQMGGGGYLNPDDSYRFGNSKFYTSSNEDLRDPATQVRNMTISGKDNPSFQAHNNVPRCPSPDYDNLKTPEVANFSRHSENKCRSPNCSFFGSAQWSGYCSKCRDTLTLPNTNVRNSTKL